MSYDSIHQRVRRERGRAKWPDATDEERAAARAILAELD